VELFQIAALAHRAERDKPYHEFLHKESMSAGVYVLPAGGVDGQQPHTEDEAYYVVSGRAQIRVGGEDAAVKAGSLVFVGAGVPHRFHSIEEDLTVLVFFAPAKYSRREPRGAPVPV
jgi:mannose-6-phosphate isomerase-like protein (cupin superfamily)